MHDVMPSNVERNIWRALNVSSDPPPSDSSSCSPADDIDNKFQHTSVMLQWSVYTMVVVAGSSDTGLASAQGAGGRQIGVNFMVTYHRPQAASSDTG